MAWIPSTLEHFENCEPQAAAVSPLKAISKTEMLSASATLADVLRVIEALPRRDRRHVEMKSALRRMGDVLRRPLNNVPADPARLRALVSAAPRASVGMSKERWSRVRSLTSAALRDVGIDVTPGRDVGGRSQAWQELADTLPTKGLFAGLSRFMSHCTRANIEPHEVAVSTFDDFQSTLAAKSLKCDPDSIYRSTVRCWNSAVTTVPAWPTLIVPLERHSRYYSLPWEDFPASFVADIDAFLAGSRNEDLFDDHWGVPVKASTVAVRRRQLRQLASALVLSGFPAAGLVSLRLLIQSANAKAALKALNERQGGQKTVSLGAKAWLLSVIARHWVRDDAVANELRQFARRLTKRQTGMTERNRTRLRQFEIKENLYALLLLPEKVVDKAQRERVGDEAEARLVMLALAVELLIFAPMRVGNLTALELERHITTIGLT